MNLPLVTIAINNHNYGRYLEKAIRSALEQDYPAIEVVVVDDGSTDNSREIIGAFAGQVIPILKENQGQASAFNAGFEASRGDIICLLDSDDFYLPSKVAEIVKRFRSDPTIGWCFHALQRQDAAGQMLGMDGEETSFLCDCRASIRKGVLKFRPPATSALCFRRRILEQILPLPVAPGVELSDNYLKCAALALSPGYYLGKGLAVQLIHTENRYTLNDSRGVLHGRVLIRTACALRERFPELRQLTNRMFAYAVSEFWQSGRLEGQYRELGRNYSRTLSVAEQFQVWAHATLHYVRYLGSKRRLCR